MQREDWYAGSGVAFLQCNNRRDRSRTCHQMIAWSAQPKKQCAPTNGWECWRGSLGRWAIQARIHRWPQCAWAGHCSCIRPWFSECFHRRKDRSLQHQQYASYMIFSCADSPSLSESQQAKAVSWAPSKTVPSSVLFPCPSLPSSLAALLQSNGHCWSK